MTEPRFDVERGRRKLTRYLGADESRWDRRFRDYLHDGPAARGRLWLRLEPEALTVTDLSYDVDPADPAGVTPRPPSGAR